MVFPRPAVPNRMRLRPAVRKFKVKARSISARSIFLGQFHSKSAMGLKRPRWACARRRSRLRRARSWISERAISSSSWRGLQRPVEARASKSSRESAVRSRLSCWSCWASSSFGFFFGVLGELIVSLQRGIGENGQIFQIRATREVDGQGSLASRLAVATGQDKGHRRKPRSVLLQGLVESRGEFVGTVIIEQVEQLGGEASGGFPVLESRLQEGLALRDQRGQTTGGRRAQGLAFSFEQGLAMSGILDLCVPVVGARVRSDFFLAVEQAHTGGRSDQG